MNFYKHYIGDFQRDTGHLSLTERGAYLALIHHYYATEKPLPNNLDSLCRIAGAVSAIERKAVKSVMVFFESVDSGLMHSRIEAEIHKAGEQSNTNRNIALQREAKRRAEKEAKEKHEDSTNRAQGVTRNEHENSTNQTPDTRHQLKPSELTHSKETNTTHDLTLAGSVCFAIKQVYESRNKPIMGLNQSNPKFIACLKAGATVEEFIHAATVAVENGKEFNYIVGIVTKQRQDAANLNLHHGTLPPSKNTNRDSYYAEKGTVSHERDITGEATLVQ